MSAAKEEVQFAAKKAAANNDSRQVDSTGEAKASLTPELVVALCGPIGSPLHDVAEQLEGALAPYGYSTQKVRLSQIIAVNAEKLGTPITKATKLAEIQALIAAGDKLREIHGNDILAKIAIAKIRADRDQKFGGFNDKVDEAAVPAEKKIKAQRLCHVIDSIKNKFELELLRLVYGDALLSIGVFSPLEVRRANLENSTAGGLKAGELGELINTDSGEEFSHGQSVRDTFPRCDFFLRVDYSVFGPTETQAAGQISTKLRRLFGLIFRTAVITPTAEETAMYAAASAARNSACLSRQVGAAITSRSGELLSVGWNDVPQAGGGLYGKPPLVATSMAIAAEDDRRCFARAGTYCSNDREKKEIAGKVAALLVSKSLVKKEDLSSVVEAISNDTQVKDLIEFSRAVHAEMHAILGASRVAGDRVVNGKIFVTTYPCHSCARHIVAAGITEVHYIEPYRKSMATKLHPDAMSESIADEGKVKLIQFDGVSPRRFIDVFEAGDRKAGGVLNLATKEGARPSTRVSLKAIPRLEEAVVAELETKDVAYLSLSTA